MNLVCSGKGEFENEKAAMRLIVFYLLKDSLRINIC
jgi:hypothetical protein